MRYLIWRVARFWWWCWQAPWNDSAEGYIWNWVWCATAPVWWPFWVMVATLRRLYEFGALPAPPLPKPLAVPEKGKLTLVVQGKGGELSEVEK